jgi:formate dehydrogenase major subunit
MTNHVVDARNSDCVFVIGSNVAENHPVIMRWINEARDTRGAKLIVVDPRISRTAAKADVYAKMRSGTDIAFIGGMVNYVIQNKRYHEEYVKEYTDASFLVNTDFKAPADLDGMFSGYDAEKRSYAKSTWTYQVDDKGVPMRDKTLQSPNTVFQLMKKHYARYDADKVCAITGTPKEDFLKVCETYAQGGKTDKTGVIMYAMGTTQHTYGTQNIRAYSILQLLLGNMGVAGGGIDALRGENNVQGSTDMGLLSNLLTAYLKVPLNTDATLAAYNKRTTPANSDPLSVNWWSNTPKYMTSLLKAWYGEAATKDNDFGFHYIPKVTGANQTHIAIFEAMEKGTIKGLMCWGQNPVVGGPDASMEAKAMEKLDWLVCTDLWETETSIFWKAPGVNPADIKTEVFLLPAASSVEKEGTVSNTGRWIQWRYQAVEPVGNAKSDAEMVSRLVLKLKELYNAEKGPSYESITKLTWPYGEHPHIEDVSKEINGYTVADNKPIAGFANLKDDGTTASGCWIYCGTFGVDGTNMTKRRDNSDPTGLSLYANWAYAWPMNRRIIYNRASVDPNGNPWDPKRAVIKWDAEGKKWVGDVADGGAPPLTVDPATTKLPFIMRPEGVGCFFGKGMAEGPFPEHYEPWESPTKNSMSSQQAGPTFAIWKVGNPQGTPDKYPIVATTYRVTEHWQTGAMTRNLPWLNELMPEMFIEVSEELAGEKGIKNGDQIMVDSARGSIKAVAMVTKRFQPFTINGKKVHEIGMPWHWGYAGLAKGAIANILTPHVGDANTTIPEYKAFLCDIRKA